MKKLLTVLLIFCAFTMSAQITQVSGNQSGIWEGEVHITGDVIVDANDSLTINPGTSVIADGYFGITVYGAFYAIGEEDARISFTVADTTGYSYYEMPELGAWQGITFSKADIKIDYCDFSYGKTQQDGDGGAMRIYNSKNVEIANSAFHHNTMRRKGGAIYAENSTITMHDCEVYKNFGTGFQGSYCWGAGFQFLKCDLTMNDMVFFDNYSDVAYGGGMNIDSCNMEMNNVVFYDNRAVDAGGLGIQRCKGYSVKVSNMLAYNNGVLHYGGGLAMATSDPELNNLTIVDNYCGGGGGGGMQNAFNAAPTLNNCIFWGNREIININDKDTIEQQMGSQIWLWGSDCRPVFNNSDIQYGREFIAGGEYLTDENFNEMIYDDPLFANPEARDYQLLANSPCINKGVKNTSGLFIPDTDLAGAPRIFDNIIDMGCYEWNNIGVDEYFAEESTVSVYPNPLNDNAICVVRLNKQSEAVLRLISLDGKEIYRENCGTLGAGENHIPLEKMMKNIQKGNQIYLLNIDNQYIKIVY